LTWSWRASFAAAAIPNGDLLKTGVRAFFCSIRTAPLRVGAGVAFRDEDGKILLDNMISGGPAEKLRIDFGRMVVEPEGPADRVPKAAFLLPAVLLVPAL